MEADYDQGSQTRISRVERERERSNPDVLNLNSRLWISLKTNRDIANRDIVLSEFELLGLAEPKT